MKFILVIILFLFLIGPIIRFAFRFFVMNKIVKEQKKYYNQESNRKEGEIRVENATPNRTSRTKDTEGQYVDFEEVK